MDRAVAARLDPSPRTISLWRRALATLEVIESERLVQNAARTGARLLAAFEAMVPRYELVKTVRGKGLMIGVEFGPPNIIEAQSRLDLARDGSTPACSAS